MFPQAKMFSAESMLRQVLFEAESLSWEHNTITSIYTEFAEKQGEEYLFANLQTIFNKIGMNLDIIETGKVYLDMIENIRLLDSLSN